MLLINRMVGAAVLLGLSLDAAGVSLDDWQINLFASQTMIHTDEYDFLGETEDGVSLDYSELGLTLVTPRYSRLYGSAQLLSRRAGKNDNGDLRLDYAFLSYDLHSTLDSQVVIKAGRLQHAYGLYNESRDVAFTRTGIFMPQGIYSDRIRNSRFTAEGAELRWQRSIGLDVLTLRYFYGVLEVDDAEVADFSPGNFVRSMEGNPGWSVRLEYAIDEGQTLLVTGYREQGFDYEGELRVPVNEDDQLLTVLSLSGEMLAQSWYLGVEYNTENWTYSVEYHPLEMTFLGKGLDTDSLAYYGQVKHRFARSWSWMLSYEVYYLDEDDKQGTQLEASGVPSETAYAKSAALGLTFSPGNHWMVKAEWRHSKGLALLSARENPELVLIDPEVTLEDDWDLVALQVAFRY